MRTRLTPFALLVLLSAFAARAEAVPIVVSADATVAGGAFANLNFGDDDFGGGLLSGLDGSGLVGPYRFYLMFALPAFIQGTFISSSMLEGAYTFDWDTFDDRTHSFYQAPTGWSESAITWNNQPGSIGGPLAAFNAALSTPGSLLAWDLTSAVNAAYLAHNALFALLFRADNEAPGSVPVVNNNLEYFASREYLGGANPFTLNVTVAAVPEPAVWLLLATGAVAVVGRRRRG